MISDSDRKNFQGKRRNALFALDTTGAAFDIALSVARDLAEEARNRTYYDELGIIADRIRFYEPNDVQNIVYSAQSLVNREMPFAARDVLLAALALVPGGHPHWFELQGLLGRVAKQIFLDSPDRTLDRARQFLDEAIAAYRTAFEKEPTKAFWHGGNLAALLTIHRSLGGAASRDTDPVAFSNRLKQVLDEASEVTNVWWHATYVEAELGARNWQAAAERLKLFLDCASKPFPVESLLRQLTEVWALDGPRSPPMVASMLGLLRAKLLIWTGTLAVQMSVAEITSGTLDSEKLQKSRDDLQKAFGDEAPRLIDWWILGIDRAKSVAAICAPNELNRPVRMGTGFLVKLRNRKTGGDAGCFVLTNAHVIGDPSPSGAAIPSIDSASVRFEGHDPEQTIPIKEIVWSSPVGRHDATVLRIDGCPADIKPIPMCRQFPPTDGGSPLYVIGHSGGNELAFSFRDNRLLDHEASPTGRPGQAGVVLVHYTTPTTNGNSGSPVFVERQWRAIALHHSGSAEMRKLNGKAGTYRANEGIALASISDALAAEKDLEFCF
jgi:hypothetical protein